MMMRSVTLGDVAAIAGIYNHYIEHTTITFEEDRVTLEEMERRIQETTTVYPWFVWEEEGRVLGYAYGRAYHARSAYRLTVETAIYLDHTATGKGAGTALYRFLLDVLTERGYHVALGGIALPNDASVRLHERCGFEKVSHFREVGWKFSRWIDVGYWQRMLAKA